MLYVLPPELFADTHYLSPGEFIFLFLALDFKIELQPLSDSNPKPKPNPNPNSYPNPNPNPNEINLEQTLKTDWIILIFLNIKNTFFLNFFLFGLRLNIAFRFDVDPYRQSQHDNNNLYFLWV